MPKVPEPAGAAYVKLAGAGGPIGGDWQSVAFGGQAGYVLFGAALVG